MNFWTSIVTGVIIAITATSIFSILSWIKKRALRRRYVKAPQELAEVIAKIGDASYWQAFMEFQKNPFSVVDNTPAVMSYISAMFWRCFDTNRRTLLEYMPDIGENIDIMAANITIGEFQLLYLHKIMHNASSEKTTPTHPGFMSEDT